MTKDFKSNLTANISKISEEDSKELNENKENNTRFKIDKKEKDKTSKKAFPLYLEEKKIKELDKISKKTGYSRNEIIDKMISYCIENIEFE